MAKTKQPAVLPTRCTLKPRNMEKTTTPQPAPNTIQCTASTTTSVTFPTPHTTTFHDAATSARRRQDCYFTGTKTSTSTTTSPPAASNTTTHSTHSHRNHATPNHANRPNHHPNTTSTAATVSQPPSFSPAGVGNGIAPLCARATRSHIMNVEAQIRVNKVPHRAQEVQKEDTRACRNRTNGSIR